MLKGKHIRHRRRWVIGVWALILVLAGIVLTPFVEPYLVEQEKTELIDAGLPASVQDLRVVYVSDFAQGGWPSMTISRAAGIMRDVNRQIPDLVLLGGDYAASPEGTIAFFEAMPRVSASLGCYAVLGEKDRHISLTDAQKKEILRERDPDGVLDETGRQALLEEAEEAANAERIERLRAVMAAKGITLLVNETASVRYGDGTIVIVGMDEPTYGRPNFTAAARQVTSGQYVILLAHNPSQIEEAIKAADANGAQDWFDLALFGHTMGNQFFGGFNPLGIAADVTTASHRKGWIREAHDTPMLISRGIGTVGLPVRLGCRPQIHVIDIRKNR